MFWVALVVFLGWIGSVCLHEFGHAIVAYWGGDTSVKDKGYLTLNPLKYTNLSLSLVMPLIFLLLGGIPLPGAAVYVDTSKLRNRAWRSAVSAAGPIATILVALVLALPFSLGYAPSIDPDRLQDQWIWYALAFLVTLEIAGAILNLLPVPALDGYGILEPWLPASVQVQLRKRQQFGILFVFGLLWLVPQANRLFWGTVRGLSETIGVSSTMAALGYRLFSEWAAILLVGMIGLYVVLKNVSMTPSDRWQQRGMQLLQANQPEAAIAAFDRSLSADPNQPEIWYNRGVALVRSQQLSAALMDFDLAIYLEPDQADFWQGRGGLLEAMGQLERAIVAYQQTLQHDPDRPQIHYQLAVCYAQTDQVDQALEALEQAIGGDSAFATAAHQNQQFSHLKTLPRFQALTRQ